MFIAGVTTLSHLSYIVGSDSGPVEVCEGRDPKGLYRMVREGKIKGFTGIDDPYEPPLNSEVVCETHFETPQQSARKVTSFVVKYLACQDCA